jgi:hypothetical protein
VERQLAAFFARWVTGSPLGYLRLDREAWRQLPERLADLALARSVQAVTCGPYPPSTASLASISTMARKEAASARTLGGAWIAVVDAAILVCREAGRVTDDQAIEPDRPVTFDRRFVVACGGGPAGLRVRPLRVDGVVQLPAERRKQLRRARVPARAIQALPGIWLEDRLLASAAGTRTAELAASFTFRSARPAVPGSFGGRNVV